MTETMFERFYPIGFLYHTKSGHNPYIILGRGEWKSWDHDHWDKELGSKVWKRVK